MKRNPDGRCFAALNADAPDVPKGVRPRDGVEYGCGAQNCRDCYEVIPRYELRPGDISDFYESREPLHDHIGAYGEYGRDDYNDSEEG